MRKKAMWKKVVSVMMAGCFCAAMFAGCGNSSTTSSTTSGSSASGSEDASSDSSSTTSESTSNSTSGSMSGSTSGSSAAELTDVPEGFDYTPVENTTGEEITICALTVSNNPFWNTVVDGINAAKDYLAGQNVTVDMVEFDDFDGQAFSEAIDTCIAQQYDAITTVGVADSIIPAIDRATEAGIPVYTFNSDVTQDCSRVAFVGQDLYAAGQMLADEMAELIGEEGKVAIITGYYSTSAHELRRQGIEDRLAEAYPNIEVVGSVENHDSGDEAYSAAKNFITADPDLKGIFVTAGGPHGAAKALSELELSDQIALCCFDTTDEIISYLETGDIKVTIDQDPFAQGCNPIVLAYNQVVTGETPVTGNAFTALDVYTPDNVDELK